MRIFREILIFVIALTTTILVDGQEITIDTIDVSGCTTIPNPHFKVKDSISGGQLRKHFYPVDLNASYSYSWDFGNGTTGSGVSNLVDYSIVIDENDINSQTFFTSLTITDNSNPTCEIRENRVIRQRRVLPPARPEIYAYKELRCRDLKTSFNYTHPTTILTSYDIYWETSDTAFIDSYFGFNPEFSFNSPGRYNIKAVVVGATDTARTSVWVSVAPNANIDFLDKNDTAAIKGSQEVIFRIPPQFYQDTSYSYVIDPIGDSSVIITNSFTLENLNPSVPPIEFFTYPDTGTYSVKARVSYPGCISRRTLNVTVWDDLMSENNTPNYVTPDADENNYFGVSSNGDTPLRLTIYSRAGTKVFEETNLTIEWDCTTSHGVPVSPGIYYYVLEAMDGSGYVKTDFFYVIR